LFIEYLFMGTPNKMVLYNDDITRVAEISKFIDANFDQQLNVKNLCKKFTISSSTLQRHFISCYDKPVSIYIRRCRMFQAMALIIEHSIPISQIGFAVGYNHRSAFTHAFTKFFGKPPAFFSRSTPGNNELI